MFGDKPFVKSLMLCTICVFCCVLSCKVAQKKPEVMKNAKYRSISRILKDAKAVDIHADREMCRSLLETISQRSALEILSLTPEEKNEILRIAITAAMDFSGFVKAVAAKVNDGLASSIQGDSAFKKELLEYVDVLLDMTAIKVILSDGAYVEIAEIDSILFGMALVLGNAMGIEAYENIESALKEGNSEKVVDILSKTSIEVVLYSYSIIRNREDLQKISIAGVKLIDLLPEIKLDF